MDQAGTSYQAVRGEDELDAPRYSECLVDLRVFVLMDSSVQDYSH